MPGAGSDGVYYNIYDELDTSPVEWHITEVGPFPLDLTSPPFSPKLLVPGAERISQVCNSA